MIIWGPLDGINGSVQTTLHMVNRHRVEIPVWTLNFQFGHFFFFSFRCGFSGKLHEISCFFSVLFFFRIVFVWIESTSKEITEMFHFVQPTLAWWCFNAGWCFNVAYSILSLTGSGMQISNWSVQMVLMLRLISAQPFPFPLPSLLSLAKQDL